MARVLMPSDYGLMGMIALYVAAAGLFVDGGLSAGLVQCETLDPDQITSVFYLNVAIGLLMAIVLCAIAPLIASFYRQPALFSMTCAMGGCMLVGSFGVVPAAIMYRSMDLRRLAMVNFIVTPTSGAAGLILALCGFGAWSLVLQRIVATGIGTGLYWWHSHLRLQGKFRMQALRQVLPLSLRLLGVGLSGAVADNACNAAIGKWFRPADVGFYSRAYSLARLPMDALDTTLGRVFFPILARLQADPEQFKSKSRRYLQISTITVVPLMALMTVASAPLVACLLTAKWMPCVAYMQLFCLASVFWLWQRAHVNILTAKGMGSLLVRVEAAKRMLQVIALASTIGFGITVVVCGQVVVTVMSYFLHAYLARQWIRYLWVDQCRDLLPVCLAGGLVAAVAWGAGQAIPDGWEWFRLAAEICAGSAAYILSIYLGRNGWATEVVREVRTQVNRILSRRRK
jgi:teichuronic acid exporter